MKSSVISLFIVMVALLAINSYAETSKPKVKPEKLSIATFAGGCFWCTEADFEKLPGVYDAISGFSGGHVVNPTMKPFQWVKRDMSKAYRFITTPNSSVMKPFWRHSGGW